MRIFFLFIALLSFTLPLQGQGGATWWYPLGSPEGTRQSLGNETVTTDSTIRLKWRTTDIRDAEVVLVGSLMGGTGATRQQIVGFVGGDTLILLSDAGIVSVKKSYFGLFSGNFSLHLTGLFDPTSSGSFAAGRPRYIGIGVERDQAQTGDSLVAFLADPAGNLLKRLALPPLPPERSGANRRAGLYPVAAYIPLGGDPTVLVAVEQPTFSPNGTDTLVNGLYRFTLAPAGHNFPEDGRLQEIYPVAPAPYPQHPALVFDNRTVRRYIVLSTRNYNFSPVATITPTAAAPVNGTPTRSNEIVSVDIGDYDGILHNIDTRRLPDSTGPGTQGRAGSYIATLYDSPGSGGEFFRVITENHSPADPGTAQIRLEPAFEKGTRDYGSFSDPSYNNGSLRVVTADIDGDPLNTGTPERPTWPNNTNDEIVVARQVDARTDIVDNRLDILRYNTVDAGGGPARLVRVASQPFSGRLMAAGDLLRDSLMRQELVVANGDTVRILQLLPYKDPLFALGNNTFFRTVKEFRLDAPVVSVAIADVEGDGANDLVVVTQQATWAIGIRQRNTFDTVRSDTSRYCRGTPAKVSWTRRIGGGEKGLRLLLMNPSGGETLLATHLRSVPNRDTSITIQTASLAPGNYRLRIEDVALPSVGDTSGTFTVVAQSIFSLGLDGPPEHRIGDVVAITGRLSCVDGLRLERSFQGGSWERVDNAGITLTPDSFAIATTIPCPASLACGAADTALLLYRVIDPAGRADTPTIALRVVLPKRTLTLEPGDTSLSRYRQIRFSSADFQCSTIDVAISSNNGASWTRLPVASRDSGVYSFAVADELSGSLTIRLCCDDGSSCEYALASFNVNRLPEGNYVAPNPFNPGDRAGGGEGDARIVYLLQRSGGVTVSIYDASRALVRRLLDGEMQEAGRHIVQWNGRNIQGEIVANGAYICRVESSSGDDLILPIYVMKRR